MRFHHMHDDILVIRDDLIAFAWSAPMRQLAAKLDLSDVGLKKLLTGHGIVCPPQGYWNKVLAGKPVIARPKAPARRPGEIGRVRLDRRFANVLPTVAPMASTGPFASSVVPEDLEELRSAELAVIKRIAVPKSLDGAHRGLREIIQTEARRREKVAKSDWHWDAPKFDNPLAKRRLRILNGIFEGLTKRGHDGRAYERDGEMYPSAVIGDTSLGLELEVLGKHRTARINGYIRPAPDLPASTPLIIRVKPTFDREAGETWCDDVNGRLEDKLAQIVAGIIVAGEAKFRRELREAETRAEQRRVDEEKRRQERLAELNRERLSKLFESGELLRKAQEIRALVANVRTVMRESGEVAEIELRDWEAWALSEADKVDPIRSGQFRTHLKAPTLQD